MTTLWLWPGQALYVGPGLGLDEHAGSVSCLAVGLEGAFGLSVDGAVQRTRSALIPPRLAHRIDASGPMAFCYLDPASTRVQGALSMMDSAAVDGISFDHQHAEALAARANRLGSLPEAEAWVELASGMRQPLFDRRIQASLAVLRDRPSSTVTELSAAAALSTSRYLHLFREQTGTTLRRYRSWVMMLRVASSIRAGSDLTRASADAGFASPSHFSTAFHSMFGLTPSHLLASGVRLEIAA